MSRLLKEDAVLLGEAYGKILLNELSPWTIAGEHGAPGPEKREQVMRKSLGLYTAAHDSLRSNPEGQRDFHMFLNKVKTYENIQNAFKFDPAIAKDKSHPDHAEQLSRTRTFFNICGQVYDKVTEKIVNSPNGILNLVDSPVQQKWASKKGYTSIGSEAGLDDRHILSAWMIDEVFGDIRLGNGNMLNQALGSQAVHVGRDFVDALIKLGVIKHTPTGMKPKSRGSSSTMSSSQAEVEPPAGMGSDIDMFS